MEENESKEFGRLIDRVNAGSDPAARQLYELFTAEILYVVRQHLPRMLRPKFDSLDFVQDAWVEFWSSVRKKKAFRRPEEFVAFLSRMARNIVADAVREGMLAKKRDVSREVSFQHTEANRPWEVADRQPTPSQTLMRKEEWQQFLAQQPPAYQLVFVLYREGKNATDIAQETGISRRNVDRILARVLQGPATDAKS